MKPIRVTQVGKINATFVVRNPKKIEYWKKIANEVSGNIGLVITTYEEIRK